MPAGGGNQPVQQLRIFEQPVLIGPLLDETPVDYVLERRAAQLRVLIVDAGELVYQNRRQEFVSLLPNIAEIDRNLYRHGIDDMTRYGSQIGGVIDEHSPLQILAFSGLVGGA